MQDVSIKILTPQLYWGKETIISRLPIFQHQTIPNLYLDILNNIIL